MIPVSKPRAVDRDIFKSIMESSMFTNNGELVTILERRLEARLRVPNFVAMSNGTMALESAISMLFNEGDTLAIPSFTFVAVAAAVVRCGCDPLFVDITPDTWTMSYDAYADQSDVVDGIIAVNSFGVAPDRRFLSTSVPLLYDNAQGFGTHTGLFGDMDVYSLHATKIVNSAEGGGIACTDEHAEHLRRWRNFGFDGTTGSVEFAGTNAKMSEFHAALAHESIAYESREVSQRRRLFDVYKDRLGGVAQFQIGGPLNCVILTERRGRIERSLAENGIDSRPYFYPLHKMPAFLAPGIEVPVTDYVSERALALPLWGDMTEEMVGRICEIVKGEL